MESRLHEVTRLGDVCSVRCLLASSGPEERSRQLTGVDRRGYTPLVSALASGKVDVAIALIENGSNQELSSALFAVSPYGRNVLHCAAEQGEAAAVRDILVLAARAELRSRLLTSTTTHCEWTALHLASTKGHGSVVRALLEGATAEERRSMLKAEESQGRTPFLVITPWIAGDEERRAALTLMEYSPPEDWAFMLLSPDRAGKTMLHHLAEKGQSTEAEALLALADSAVGRGDMLTAASCDGSTPLHLAAHHGHDATARLLLEQCSSEDRGRLLRAEDLKGCTAFDVALRSQSQQLSKTCARLDVAMVLLEYSSAEERSIALPKKAPNGKTLLHFLAMAGEEEKVRALLLLAASAGGPEELRRLLTAPSSSAKGWTALHSAACSGRAGVVRILMEHADTAARAGMLAPAGGKGRSPLHLALGENARDGGDAFCALLSGATDSEAHRLLTARDDAGDTALMFAKERQGHRIDRALISKILGWSDPWGKTLLHRAAECGDTANIPALIDLACCCRERTGRLLSKDAHGWTPLHRAAFFGQTKACEVLLGSARSAEERNQLLAQQTPEGWSVWHFAEAGSVELPG